MKSQGGNALDMMKVIGKGQVFKDINHNPEVMSGNIAVIFLLNTRLY